MAFSSYIGGGNRRGGGWGHSILPSSTSNPNSKSSKLPHRKSRKRTALREFLIANFFAIGLSISLLLFIFVVYRYGIPRPISSHFVSHNSRGILRPRKPSYRKPLDRDVVSAGAAAVDITTKDMYDRIEFSDVDGGPWKQGWRVSYNGNEWDSEKLKVFVVPHSHNDPGWKLTVEEYYDRQSRHILDTIVDTLSKDVRRKFIWEEMSYLERWWRDATDEKREAFTNLVHNGQLEIVGGGWVMNDEANSHYFAIIEQNFCTFIYEALFFILR